MVCSLRMGNVILALEIGGIDFFYNLNLFCHSVLV